MLHHILELCLQLFSRLWPLILAVVILVPLVGLMALGIYLKKKIKSATLSQDKADEQATKRGVMSSLHRLPKQHYHVLSLVYVPRLDGQGTTRLQHVVLSRFGIVVIHLQDESGDISGGLRDANWSANQGDSAHSFVNPMIRNSYHVRALAKFLGLPEALFTSIIFFQNEVRFDGVPPPTILTKGLGRNILSHKAEIISPEVLSQALLALRPMSHEHDESAARRKHDTARTKRLKRAKNHRQPLITSVPQALIPQKETP